MNADSQSRRKSDVRRAVMDICIDGHTVHCLNHATRMSLLLDDKTAAFITAWMLPLMKQVCALPCDEPANKQMALSQVPSPDAKPTFTLPSSATPNVRDKVHWNPPNNRWDLHLKKAKGDCPEQFSVDTDQPVIAFASQPAVHLEKAGRAEVVADTYAAAKTLAAAVLASNVVGADAVVVVSGTFVSPQQCPTQVSSAVMICESSESSTFNLTVGLALAIVLTVFCLGVYVGKHFARERRSTQSVGTQSQTTYTRWTGQPRFQVLPESSQG